MILTQETALNEIPEKKGGKEGREVWRTGQGKGKRKVGIWEAA